MIYVTPRRGPPRPQPQRQRRGPTEPPVDLKRVSWAQMVADGNDADSPSHVVDSVVGASSSADADDGEVLPQPQRFVRP